MLSLLPLILTASAGESSYGIRCADLACASCEPAPIAATDADSTLPGSYGPALAFDGNLNTAWCEGADGPGLHRSINLTLSEPRVIEAILVHGGYFKSQSLLVANARIKVLNVVAGDAEGEQWRTDAALADPTVRPAEDPCMPGAPNPLDAAGWYAAARDASGAMVWQSDGDAQTVTTISFTIADVYPGAKYADTCISEIQVLTRAPEGQ